MILFLSKNYGSHLGIYDRGEYLDLGVKFSSDEKEIFQMDLISSFKSPVCYLKINALYFEESQTFIGALSPYSNKDYLENLAKKK